MLVVHVPLDVVVVGRLGQVSILAGFFLADCVVTTCCFMVLCVPYKRVASQEVRLLLLRGLQTSINKEKSLYIGIELLGKRVSETECAVLIAYK